jgi:hypothetical protein
MVALAKSRPDCPTIAHKRFLLKRRLSQNERSCRRSGLLIPFPSGLLGRIGLLW